MISMVCRHKFILQRFLTSSLSIRSLQILQAKVGKRNHKAIKTSNRILMCANISQINNNLTLKDVLFKKYNEGNSEDEAWDETIETIVKNDVQLQVELCWLLLYHNDVHSSIKYAAKYQVPARQLPIPIKNILANGRKNIYSTVPVTVNGVDQFHHLSLPQSAIIFVDSKEKFTAMLDVLQGAGVIGCDCEWKPVSRAKLAIVQISTWHQVYIIDVNALLKLETELDSHWKTFFNVFRNPKIKKLGFGFGADLYMLSDSIPEFELIRFQIRNLLDLQILCQKLEIYNPEIFPYLIDRPRRGLAEITGLCLGKVLNKTSKLTDWEIRPLIEKQIEYAALDAFCLLEIYLVLSIRAEHFGINLELVMKNSYKKKTYDLEHQNIHSPEEFKVLVDSNLERTGRYLTLLGVDVKIIDIFNQRQISEALHLRKTENRIIISGRKLNNRIYKNLEPKSWFWVDTLLPVRTQVMNLLQYYNVPLISEIFQRCQKCGSRRYFEIPLEVVNRSLRNHFAFINLRTDIDSLDASIDGYSSPQFNDNSELISGVKLFYICAECGTFRI